MQEQTHTSGDGKGFGIAGFVISILAILTCFIPVIGIILALMGLIFSIIGLLKANKYKQPKGLPLSGMIISIVATILAILFLTLMTSVFHNIFSCKGIGHDFEDNLDKIEQIGNEIEKNFDESEIQEMEKKLDELIDDSAETIQDSINVRGGNKE